MKVGIFLPQIGQAATKSNVLKVAKESENRNLDSLWVLERMLAPVNPRTPYVASPDGKLPADYQTVFDPLDLLHFVAGQTSHVMLGTSVIDMPFHNPVMLGRRFATLDVLSDGRAIAGLGLGWSKDEYEAANVPFEKKGARGDEFVQALKKVWTDDVVEFSGQYYKIAASKIGPKPVQKPHLPMLLGGFTPKTFERIAKYADGWIGVAAMPLPQLEQIISGLRAAAAAAGKKTRVFLLAYPYVGEAKVPEETRAPLTGTVQQVGTDIEKIREMGVEHLVLAVNAFTPFMRDASAYVDLTAQLAHHAR
ncbi:MAG: TIGR03619 family F420-dependent LLM class oxidoreductase [Nitrososphaera sp.]